MGSEGTLVDDYFRQYGLVAILAVVAVIVPSSMLLLSWLASRVRIRPQKPNLLSPRYTNVVWNLLGANGASLTSGTTCMPYSL